MDEWKYWERYYIQCYKDKGHNIINHTVGGDGLSMGNQTSFKKGQKSWNKGARKNKICAICKIKFPIAPSEDKKYKCCSMECSSIYRSLNPNKGTFKKDSIPWNKGVGGYTINSKNCKSIIQIDCNTNIIINEYESISKAARNLKINADSISNVICGRSKSAGGFKWKRMEKEGVNL